MKTKWLLSMAIAGALCGCQNMGDHKDTHHKTMSAKHEEEGEETNEVKMPFDKAPMAVQDALRKEAAGAKMDTVDKEMRNGMTVYETDVKKDGKTWEIVVDETGKLIPKEENYYQHNEGNSDSHVKTSLVGNSVTVLIQNGSLLLGQWQGIQFCEFDGPRTRQFQVKLVDFAQPISD